MSTAKYLATRIEEQLLERNRVCEEFFSREAGRLALACRDMAERFLQGGRLLAFGRGPYATDAQHVSVEFVHPVIVGKRALPALDLSIAFRPWLEAILRPEDMVMGFGPPEGDSEVWAALEAARAPRHDSCAPWTPGLLRHHGRNRAPVCSSGDDRDSLPHSLGNSSCLLSSTGN